MVKRYTRPEERPAPTGRGAGRQHALPIDAAGMAATPAAPAERAGDDPLRPSDPADDDGHPRPHRRIGQSRAQALQRGTLVHRLLQSLPDIAAERRREAALRYLARNAGDWTDGRARRAARHKVLALIADARFARAVRARQPRRGANRRTARFGAGGKW